MSIIVLATNAGPHPPDMWAAVAADKIGDLIQVDPNSQTPAAIAARQAKAQFKINFIADMISVFSGIASDETANVNSGATTGRGSPFNVNANYTNASLTSIVARSSGGQFASFFANPNTRATCMAILQQVFIDAANVSRSWAFDAKGQ